MNTIIKFGWVLLFSSSFFHTMLIADETKTNVKNEDDKKIGKFLGAEDATHPEWFKESFLDLEEDVNEAIESNKRLIIYFWQNGCPYCVQLWRDNFADPKVVAEFRQNFDVIALNIWGDREVINVGGADYSEKTFAKALGIKYTPTLLFFDESGKVIHRLNGYVPPDNFQKSMRYVSGKHEKKFKFSEFSIRDKADVPTRKDSALNKQDFFIKPIFDLSKRDENKNHTVVFFEAPDCKNCDLLHQKTLKDPTTLDLAKKFMAVQLDRYSTATVITPNGKTTTAKQWAIDLDIEYLPAMVFFDDKGKQVMRIDTQLRTFHIQSVFDYVLSGKYLTEPNFQGYISDRADRIRKSGRDIDIFAY